MFRRPFRLGIIFVVVFAFSGATWALAQEKPLDNSEIIKLTKADMGDAVIVAKIKTAAAVKFEMTTDDLVKLKDAGVSKTVITAMLERSLAPVAGAAAGSEVKVALKSTDGSVDLEYGYGMKEQSMVPFRGQVGWVKYEGYTAKQRTKDRRPSIEIASEMDPVKAGWYWVKLDQNDKGSNEYRSFDLNTQTGAWTSTLSASPDTGYIMAVESTQVSPGLWRLTPQKTLKNGEYGLYCRTGEKQIMYSFGIDK